MYKKILSIILCFFLLFSIISPPMKTEAMVPAFAIPAYAIPAGVKVSAGAMALGGAILAGVATGFAIESIDFDIEDVVGKAQDIWNSFSSALKNTWEGLFDTYWGTSPNSIPLEQSFKSALIDDIPVAYLNGSSGVHVGEAVRTTYNTFDRINGLRFEYSDEEFYFIIFEGSKYAVYKTLDIWMNRYYQGEFSLSNRIQYNGSISNSGKINAIDYYNWNDIRENIMINIQATLSYINIYRDTGPAVSVIPSFVLEEFNRMRADIYSSTFPLINANEIYFPFDSIYPYAESLGKEYPLEWNADIEAFVLPSNPSVPYQGSIGWHIPSPVTYIDSQGKVRVGYQTIDGTIMDTLTGETVGSGTIPDEGDVPAGFFDGVLQGIGSLVSSVGNILDLLSSLVELLTTGLIGDLSAINFDKMRTVGYNFTTKFPFSIPWDVGRAFDSIFGGISGGSPPVWDFKISFLGHQYSFAITIPEYLFNWFPIVRTFILVLFDIGIIYSVRQWLGGSS